MPGSFTAAAASTVKLGTMVSRSTTQSIPDSTWTAVSFDTEIIDTLNSWVVGSPTRFTIPKTGWYDISAGVYFEENATGIRAVKLNLNGLSASNGIIYRDRLGSTLIGIDQIATQYYFTLNDYIEVMMFQNSGAPRTLKVSEKNSPVARIVAL